MKKGFTLIELLIVIAIIGIIAGAILVSTNASRNKAQAATLKQSISSLKAAVLVCCATTTNTLGSTAGSDVCTPVITALLPQGKQLGLTTDASVTYGVSGLCSSSTPAINVSITNHPKTECNSIYTVSGNGIYYGAINIATPMTTAANLGFPAGC